MTSSKSAAGNLASPPSQPAEVDIRRLIPVVIAVMLGILLAALDQTIVGTAMPRVIADLGGLEHYAWVFTAYMLASTVTVPIYGKLSDIYGRRPFFMLGMVLFLAGSALSGMSQSMSQLIIFRGIQGLGAGAMIPIAIAIIGDIFPPSERGKWQGLTAGMFGVASIVGPTAGGWITDNWGWHWVFYVNMPVGALALLAAAVALPGQTRRREHTVDYLGAAMLIAGAVPMLLAFSWAGTEYAWGSLQIIGLLAFSLVVLVTFFWHERRVPEPILTPSLFRNKIFATSVISTFLIAAGMFGAIMYLPLFVQGVMGNSATNSGVVLTPMMLGFVASSIIGGQIMSRTGRYKALTVGSLALATLGMFLLARMEAGVSQATLVRNMIITGLGIGATMSLFTIVVQNAFNLRQLGEVTAGLQFFRSIGGTIGVAILGSVMTNRFQSAMESSLPSQVRAAVPPDRLAEVENPQLLLSPEATQRIQQSFRALGSQGEQLFGQLMGAIRTSLDSAITDLFFIGALIMTLALLASFVLPEIPLRRRNETPVVAEGPGIEPVPPSIEPRPVGPLARSQADRRARKTVAD